MAVLVRRMKMCGTIELRPVRVNELEAWYRHCQEVFNDAEQGHFQKHFENDPEADASLIFVAMDGEEIVSTVRLFKRRVWIQGRAVSMGGIGEVSTKPAYRGRGLASRLLEMAIDAMSAQDMPVSILFGDEPLYEKAGWRFCPISGILSEISALPDLPENAAIRPFMPEDLPYLMGIYDLYAGRLHGAVIRSEAYWHRWVLPQWRPPTILVYEGRPAAYCSGVADCKDRVLMAEELCAAPQAEVLVPAFLRSVAEVGQCTSVRVAEPPAPGVMGTVWTKDKEMMIRLNRPFGAWRDTEGLVDDIKSSAGMFSVDMF